VEHDKQQTLKHVREGPEEAGVANKTGLQNGPEHWSLRRNYCRFAPTQYQVSVGPVGWGARFGGAGFGVEHEQNLIENLSWVPEVRW